MERPYAQNNTPEGIKSTAHDFSSKGKPLIKIKKGFYKPPSARICVPGFHWTGLLLAAPGEIPGVCRMSWWTTRGKHKEVSSNIMFRMF